MTSTFSASPLNKDSPTLDIPRTTRRATTVVADQHSPLSPDAPPSQEPMRPEPEILNLLDRRLGSPHAIERLRLESAHEQRMTRGGLASLRARKLHSSPKLIRGALKSVGLYRRGPAPPPRGRGGEKNFPLSNPPHLFGGVFILPFSRMHVDIKE